MLELVPMTQADYEFWSLRSRMNYAQSKIKANRIARDEAVKAANAEFERHLPDGLKTKDNFLYSGMSENSRVGFVWIQIRGSGERRRAYVCDIIVEPDHRGKGYGKEMMVAVERAAVEMGMKKIGLHVFGYNEPAIALYKSLGYVTTDLEMEKTLD
jgi:ribosomal protein S18 acetylase RimI-like enzyme